MRNFTQFAAAALLGVAGVLGVLYFFQWNPFSGDDDRPPVVVSSGSVDIESQVDAQDGDRGAFEEVTSGDRKKWRAGHGKGKKPQKLTVIITGSTSTSTPQCGPTFVHRNVTSTVTFGYEQTDGSDAAFTVGIGQVNNEKFLELNFPVDADWSASEPYRLSLPDATLQSVTIGNTTCDLGSRGRVEIRQRK